MTCSAGALLWSSYAFVAGVALLIGAVRKWLDPPPGLGGRELTKATAQAAVPGAIFSCVGFMLLIEQLACGSYAQLSDMLNLAWTWWPGMWLGAIFGAGICFWNSRSLPPLPRVGLVLAGIGFGVAGGEAAGFHTGVYAERWFALAFVIGTLAGAILWFSSRRTNNAEAPKIP